MNKITHYFKTPDQNKFFYQNYKAAQPKGVLLIVHGLNEHSSRYEKVARYFQQQQYNVYTYDHRGHGRSEGLKSYIDRFGTFIEDLDYFINEIILPKEADLDLHMLGHSMGGQISLNYIATKPHSKIKSLITSGANIRVAVSIPKWKRYAVEKLNLVFPKLKIPNELDPGLVCKNEEVVKEYIKDPYCYKFIRSNLALEMLKNQDQLLDLASNIKIPTLMLHGTDDQLASFQGSVDFHELISHSQKQIKLYDGLYHEILNEKDQIQIFQDIYQWIQNIS